MKGMFTHIGHIGVAVLGLFLLMGTAAPAFAQLDAEEISSQEGGGESQIRFSATGGEERKPIATPPPQQAFSAQLAANGHFFTIDYATILQEYVAQQQRDQQNRDPDERWDDDGDEWNSDDQDQNGDWNRDRPETRCEDKDESYRNGRCSGEDSDEKRWIQTRDENKERRRCERFGGDYENGTCSFGDSDDGGPELRIR